MTKAGILLELAAIANSLDCVRGSSDAARVRSAAAVIAGEEPGDTIVAVWDLSRLADELEDRHGIEPAVRLRAVVAHYVDSRGFVTHSGAMLLRQDVDEQVAALAKPVKVALAKMNELYSIFRWNEPRMLKFNTKLYDQVIDGFAYELEEHDVLASLEALNRFIVQYRPMSGSKSE